MDACGAEREHTVFADYSPPERVRPKTNVQPNAMTLRNFTVVTGGHREDGVLIEYRDDLDRCAAVFQQEALHGAFDELLHLGPRDRRLHPHEWNILAEENLRAFGRIISTRHERDSASTGKPVRRVELNLSDIQGSGETFTRDALPINTGKEWSRDDLNYLAFELRRPTPLLEIAKYLKRDVVEVETMADRIELP
jgi:hypothetical protein